MQNSQHPKRRLNFSRFGLVVGALLILWLSATTVVLLGDEGTAPFPSAANTKPSGVAAFAELLRRDGYQIVIEQNSRPTFEPTDLVVTMQFPITDFDFSESVDGIENVNPLVEKLDEHLNSGGKVINIGVPVDFGHSTLNESPSEAFLGDQSYEVSASSLQPNDYFL